MDASLTQAFAAGKPADYFRFARDPGVSEIDSHKPTFRHLSGLDERYSDVAKAAS